MIKSQNVIPLHYIRVLESALECISAGTTLAHYAYVKLQYLANLGSLTHKGFIISGKGGGIVVDVQQANVDQSMAALMGMT